MTTTQDLTERWEFLLETSMELKKLLVTIGKWMMSLMFKWEMILFAHLLDATNTFILTRSNSRKTTSFQTLDKTMRSTKIWIASSKQRNLSVMYGTGWRPKKERMLSMLKNHSIQISKTQSHTCQNKKASLVNGPYLMMMMFNYQSNEKSYCLKRQLDKLKHSLSSHPQYLYEIILYLS